MRKRACIGSMQLPRTHRTHTRHSVHRHRHTPYTHTHTHTHRPYTHTHTHRYSSAAPMSHVPIATPGLYVGHRSVFATHPEDDWKFLLFFLSEPRKIREGWVRHINRRAIATAFGFQATGGINLGIAVRVSKQTGGSNHYDSLSTSTSANGGTS